MRSTSTRIALGFTACAIVAVARPAAAQLHPIEQGNKGPVIAYEISFPNIVHHEAEVKAVFTSVPPGPLHTRMARSSTGRYALHEFAKNVYSLKAVDSKGKELAVTRPDAYGWDVAGHDGTVTVTYTLFADRADGTYPGFDAVQAHIQPQGTFLYARGMERRPVKVTVHRPVATWTIATQLVPTSDPETFTGPSMQYLFDSPTHVGAIQWREWSETSGGRTLKFRAAVDDPSPSATIDEYAAGAQKIAREAAAVYGEFPAFDYGTYTFVACYRPSCGGDGMEHRNSTSVTGGASMGTSALRELGTVAHEFFHAWNVKRIRPATLEPFDYDRANLSGELWIAEGFTQYYGPLLEARSGVTQSSAFVRSLSGTVNAVTNAPGRRFFGPIGMSQQAPFTDAAVSIDPQNRPNIFISYYTYGAGIALAIDLSLRARGGKTLDDFMRTMWKNHGKPEVPYALDDARRALAIASGDSAWAWDFWKRYIAGHELPDYPKLLENAGLLVRKSQGGAAWIGDFQFRPATGQGAAPLTINAATLIGSPIYEAGLDRGDRIVAVDGKDLATETDFRAAIAAHKPGDKVSIAYEGRGGRRDATLTIGESPAVQVVTFEEAGRTPTDQQLAFRAKWLSTPAAINQPAAPVPPGVARQLAERFALVAFGLYHVPLFLNNYPSLGGGGFNDTGLAPRWGHIFTPPGAWVARHLFNMTGPMRAAYQGDNGDVGEEFGRLLLAIVIGAVVAICWTAADRRKPRSEWVGGALKLLLRYSIALGLASYALAKIFQQQFPPLNAISLESRIGDLTPMRLLWNFMQYSRPYSLFGGVMELAAVLLLCSRRTSTLGALICLAVMSNVAALNLAYGVQVKLYSLMLVASATVLVLYDAPRLMKMFVNNQAVAPAPLSFPPTDRLSPPVRWAIKTVLVGSVLVSSIIAMAPTIAAQRAPAGELDGTWTVNSFARDGAPLDSSANPARWRRLIVAGNAVAVRLESDSLMRCQRAPSTDAHSLKLACSKNRLGELSWTRTGDVLQLDGTFDGARMSASARYLDASSFPLLRGKFRWIYDR